MIPQIAMLSLALNTKPMAFVHEASTPDTEVFTLNPERLNDLLDLLGFRFLEDLIDHELDDIDACATYVIRSLAFDASDKRELPLWIVTTDKAYFWSDLDD